VGENVLSTTTVGSLGLLWNHKTTGTVQSSPAVANGVVYVASYGGSVYAFGLKGSDAPAAPQRPDPQTPQP